MSWTSTSGRGAPQRKATRRGNPSGTTRQAASTLPPAPARPSKPGLFAPKWHKRLYAALQKNELHRLEEIAATHPEARHTCMAIDAFRPGGGAADDVRARQILTELWKSGYDPAHDTFLTTYTQTETTVSLTPALSAHLRLGQDAMGLLLAELLQEAGDLAGAIDIVEQLEPSTYAATSLAELYAERGSWDEVISLTEGLSNEDDFSTYLLIQRGVAFREQGFHSAARESFKLALAPRSRSQPLRHLAWIERAATYRAENKKAMARKDLERVLAEDSRRPGIRELIASL